MKLLEKNQLAGTSHGSAVFRDLFEDEHGGRISIPTSREFDTEKERTLPNGKFTSHPTRAAMFEKHKLNTTQNVL